TCIFLLIPFMLQLVYEDQIGKKSIKYAKIMLAILITFFLTSKIDQWSINHGMKALSFQMMINGGMQYGTAFQVFSDKSFIILFFANLYHNIHTLMDCLYPFQKLNGPDWYYQKTFYLFAIGMVVCAGSAIRMLKNDFLPLATVLLSMAIFSVC